MAKNRTGDDPSKSVRDFGRAGLTGIRTPKRDRPEAGKGINPAPDSASRPVCAEGEKNLMRGA